MPRNVLLTLAGSQTLKADVGFHMMMTNRSKRFILGLALLLAGCAHPQLPREHHSPEMTLSATKPETRPVVKFDAAQPYRFELGRGSGRDGLDTISVDQSGETVLYRQIQEKRRGSWSQRWETAKLSIGKEASQRLAKLVLELHLLEMDRAYYSGAHDGTQWIFHLTQGGNEKSIYCDNYFPKQLRNFAESIDSALKSAGLDNLKWLAVPDDKSRQHDRGMWDSIQEEPNHKLDGICQPSGGSPKPSA